MPETSADRRLDPIDRLLVQADMALRTALGRPRARRRNPGGDRDGHLADESDRRHVAGLLRVDHAGEVAAQGLYQGQALTARRSDIREAMAQAASDESDHLAWCHDRLDELGARPSLMNPLWYAGSMAIGAMAGLAGDRWSLGFVAETEQQVGRHLDDHLERLPPGDERSRAILEQMRTDELGHAQMAVAAGGRPLPTPLRQLMRLTARLMTTTAYRI